MAIEPRFSLRGQIATWALGFAIFVLLCWIIQRRKRRFREADLPRTAGANSEAAPSANVRALWLLLPAGSSLLLCAVTNYLSQNVAAVPLLWIMPLSVYLLSFIVAFNGRIVWPRWFGFCLLAAALASAAVILNRYGEAQLRLAVIPIFCTVLFLACLFCHGEVYRLRPPARYATSFYLFVSAGGAIGAFSVGVLAPLVFSANYELFWGLVLVSGLAAVLSWRRTLVWTVLWSSATLALAVLFIRQAGIDRRGAIVQTRSFYGALRVTNMPYGPGRASIRTLYNGTIEHGLQLYDSGQRSLPNTYYGPDSGVGRALRFCCAGEPRRVGVIGLGAGTLAAYGHTGDVFRFYEINRQVESIARNQFSYLDESSALVQVVLGDARISLEQEAPQHFDVLAVDAFSGDAIPVHLLTAQAIELYRRHLKPNGILAIHVTNRYLDLAPVVEQLADHAGLTSALIISPAEPFGDIDRADWVVVSADSTLVARLAAVTTEEQSDSRKDLPLWTDDYNSLLPVVRWKPREEPPSY